MSAVLQLVPPSPFSGSIRVMSDTPRRPGPDSTLAEARERLIEAATDALLARGVEIGIDHIKLSDAIETTGISRATAYRSLTDGDTEPQATLRHEVLSRLLARHTREESHGAVMRAVVDEFEANRANIESDRIEDRTAAFRSLIRVGAAASYHAVAGSRERAILIAAYGAFRSRDPRGPAWQEAHLRAGEAEIARLFSDMYSQFSEVFGFRLREGLTMSQFATAGAALVEGMAMREGISVELDDIDRRSGSNGALEPWTLFGVAFGGLYRAFFEPVDADNPFADLDLL